MKPAWAIAVRAGSGLAAVALLAGAGWYGYDMLARRPISAVHFSGDTARVPPADLDRLASGLRGREAGEVALPAVRDAVKRLPWVRDGVVRRVFPGTIEVAIEAHAPLARWDETRLVSVRGEVFAAPYAGDLPRFSGPEGAAPEMADAWRRFEAAAAPLGSRVAEIRLSERRAWQARLDSGFTFELGRGDIAARLARFAAVWPRVVAGAQWATHADLRYPNGFALRGVAADDRKSAPKGRRT
ncbi:MAG: cell division protein FtsQ/DivIB [Betaproteobacteria bacterium]|nr:cell division protein FtsQ/DivIB [Betaproteobacteria bacterium]